MMDGSELALLGGAAVRKKKFSSLPFIGDEDISLVSRLMKEGRFSKFIGSPLKGTRELLARKSKDLVSLKENISFLGGEYVRRFEAEWCGLVKAGYSISVNSATSGLITSLLAAGIKAQDEIITTPFSFTATATSIFLSGAVPVFCDLDPETFCISPGSIKRKISNYTRGIMPVHWCGNAGELNEIISIARGRDLLVIEDAAQAPGNIYHGRHLGTLGDIGVFSFNEPKNITTGEGGMIVTDHAGIAEKCRLIRNHGEVIPADEDSDEYVSNSAGYNFRLSELLAAIGYRQVKKLPFLNNLRKENYLCLKAGLQDIAGEFMLPQKITHPDSYYPYTAAFRWLPDKIGIPRDIIALALRAEGIPVSTGVSRLLCDHPVFKRRPASAAFISDLPNARKLKEEFLGFFQIGWPNSKEDMHDILRAFKKILANKNSLAGVKKTDYGDDFVSGR